MKIKKDDLIKIVLGKDTGKEGKVVRVLVKTGKVLIENANLYKRHIKKMGQTEGVIIDIAKPMDISNVMLICPNCQKVTRVGFSIKDQEKQRICRKCQKPINQEAKKRGSN